MPDHGIEGRVAHWWMDHLNQSRIAASVAPMLSIRPPAHFPAPPNPRNYFEDVRRLWAGLFPGAGIELKFAVFDDVLGAFRAWAH